MIVKTEIVSKVMMFNFLFQEMACATVGPASAGMAGQGTPVKSGWEKNTNIFQRLFVHQKNAARS